MTYQNNQDTVEINHRIYVFKKLANRWKNQFSWECFKVMFQFYLCSEFKYYAQYSEAMNLFNHTKVSEAQKFSI